MGVLAAGPKVRASGGGAWPSARPAESRKKPLEMGYVCDAVESEGRREGWMDGSKPTYRESAPWSCIRVAVSRESIG